MVAKGTIMVSPEDLTYIGEWSWNHRLLKEKIVKGDADACWQWLGSVGPFAPLYGAKKNGRPQMTQANRLIWMMETGEDAGPLQIQHTCSNRMCVNFAHLRVKKNPRMTDATKVNANPAYQKFLEEEMTTKNLEPVKREKHKPEQQSAQIFTIKREPPVKEVKRWWQI